MSQPPGLLSHPPRSWEAPEPSQPRKDGMALALYCRSRRKPHFLGERAWTGLSVSGKFSLTTQATRHLLRQLVSVLRVRAWSGGLVKDRLLALPPELLIPRVWGGVPSLAFLKDSRVRLLHPVHAWRTAALGRIRPAPHPPPLHLC